MEQRDCFVPWRKHPLKCGIPGRLYSIYDCVQPIVDCMLRLHEPRKFNFINCVKREREEREAQDRECTRMKNSSFEVGVRCKILCEGCLTTNFSDIEYDITNGVTVCKCGVTSRGSLTMEEWSGTHNSINCGPTAHEDASTTSYKGTIAQKRKNEKFAVAHGSAKSAASHCGYSAASKIVAADVAHQADGELNSKDSRKLAKLIQEVNEHLAKVAPVEPAVAKRIRITTEDIFLRAVRHRSCCGKRVCQLNICDRPMRVLACKSIMHSLQELTQGGGVDGVSNVSLVALHGRIQSNHIFSTHHNATQNESIEAIISELRKDSYCEPCCSSSLVNSRSDSGSSDSRCDTSTAVKSSLPTELTRCNSEIEPSKVVALRDAISKLSYDLNVGCEVRDAAIRCLNNSSFASCIKADNLVPKGTPRFVSAYVVLRCVMATMDKHVTPREENIHSTHLRLRGFDLDAAVTKVRSILPCDLFTTGDDDDFV